ncbi:2-oxoglutarate dehydrogenase, E2 component, dihydrolipoamide succinyltransferase, partial [Streptomyces xanthophaeus]
MASMAGPVVLAAAPALADEVRRPPVSAPDANAEPTPAPAPSDATPEPAPSDATPEPAPSDATPE